MTSLIRLWRAGRDILPFSMLGCLLTCFGSSLANCALYGDDVSIETFAQQFSVGYTGAALMAITTLPILHAIRKGMNPQKQSDQPEASGLLLAADPSLSNRQSMKARRAAGDWRLLG